MHFSRDTLINHDKDNILSKDFSVRDALQKEQIPLWAQEKDIQAGNIYHAKTDFSVNGVSGHKNQGRQFVGVNGLNKDEIALQYEDSLIFVDKTLFEDIFPKSIHSTKQLKKVALSVLWPLISRATAAKNPKLSNFKDNGSADILDTLHQDNDYDSHNVQFNKQDELFTAARTELFDEQIKNFLSKNPNGNVVNIGGGLDPNIGPTILKGDSQTTFFNIDFPEVSELQKKIFPQSPNQSFIGKSILDPSWVDQIPKDKKTLFVAEGIFMYFTQKEVKAVLMNIAENFPGAEIIFEAPSSLVKTLSRFDEDLKSNKIPFKFGISSGKKIESWDPQGRIMFIDEYPYINKYNDQRGLLGKLADKPVIGSTIQSMKKSIHLKICD